MYPAFREVRCSKINMQMKFLLFSSPSNEIAEEECKNRVMRSLGKVNITVNASLRLTTAPHSAN